MPSERSIGDIQGYRNYARALPFRSSYRISNVDVAGAISDAIAVKRMNKRLVNPEFNSLVQLLIGIAIDGVGATVPIGNNPDARPTRDDWQRLLDEENADPICWISPDDEIREDDAKRFASV